jgi:hypothetical protein
MPYDILGNFYGVNELTEDQFTMDKLRLEKINQDIKNRAAAQQTPIRPKKQVNDVPDFFFEKPGGFTPIIEPKPRYQSGNPFQRFIDQTGLDAPFQVGRALAAAYPAALIESAGFPQSAEAVRYQPTSPLAQDLLGGLGDVATALKLPPYIPGIGLRAGDARTFRPADLQVLGARGVNVGRELRNIPQDFKSGKQGMMRLGPTDELTLGAKLAETDQFIRENAKALRQLPSKVEDATIGEMQRSRVRRSASQAPSDQAYEPLRQRVSENYESGMPIMAVRKKGEGQLIFGQDTPASTVSNEVYGENAFANELIDTVAKTRDNAAIKTLHKQSFPTDMRNNLRDYIYEKKAAMFPESPSKTDALAVFELTYPREKQYEFELEAQKEWERLPETKALADQLNHTIVSFEEMEARVKAARDWATGPFKKQLATYVGTKEDPLLELASKGLTYENSADLEKRAGNNVKYRDLSNARRDAGQDPKGVYGLYVEEAEKNVEVAQQALREANAQRVDLGRQLLAANPDADPAADPTYAATTNTIDKLTRDVRDAKDYRDNMRLAKMYEDLNDYSVNKKTAKDLKNELGYAQQKAFFPFLDKTPDEAPMFSLDRDMLNQLGYEDLGNQFATDIIQGKIPIDQIKNMPLAKYVEKIAKPRVEQEKAEKLKQEEKQNAFENYLVEVANGVPENKRFNNSVAVEFDTNTPELDIRRGLSADCEVLDHCVGQGGSSSRRHFVTGMSRNYDPAFDPTTGDVPDYGSGQMTSYMSDVLSGEKKITSLRNRVSGLPIVTIEMKLTNNSNFISPMDAALEPMSNSNMPDLYNRLYEMITEDYADETLSGVMRAINELENQPMLPSEDAPDGFRSLTEQELGVLESAKNQVEALKNIKPLYNLGYISGYQNGKINSNYKNDVRDYLNSVSSEIKGIGSDLQGHAGVYDRNSSNSLEDGLKAASVKAGDVSTPALDALPRFVTVEDLKAVKADTPAVNPAGESNYVDVIQNWARDRGPNALPRIQEGLGGTLEGHPVESVLRVLDTFQRRAQDDFMPEVAEAYRDLAFQLEDFQRGQQQARVQTENMGLVGPAFNRVLEGYNEAQRTQASLILGESLAGTNSAAEVIANIRANGNPLANSLARELERQIELAANQPAPQNPPILNRGVITQGVFDQLHEHFDRANNSPQGSQFLRAATEESRRRLILNDQEAQAILDQLPQTSRGAMVDLFASNSIPHPNERNQPAQLPDIFQGENGENLLANQPVRVNAQPTAPTEFIEAMRHLEQAYGELSMEDTPETIARIIRESPSAFGLNDIRPGMRQAILEHIEQFGFDRAAQQPAQQPDALGRLNQAYRRAFQDVGETATRLAGDRIREVNNRVSFEDEPQVYLRELENQADGLVGNGGLNDANRADAASVLMRLVYELQQNAPAQQVNAPQARNDALPLVNANLFGDHISNNVRTYGNEATGTALAMRRIGDNVANAGYNSPLAIDYLQRIQRETSVRNAEAARAYQIDNSPGAFRQLHTMVSRTLGYLHNINTNTPQPNAPQLAQPRTSDDIIENFISEAMESNITGFNAGEIEDIAADFNSGDGRRIIDAMNRLGLPMDLFRSNSRPNARYGW